jgi:heme exporter protein C|tara:strand:- start:682 stop:831 length:150 start_codon:yes stop_codon:yes gene_type:complete
MKYFNFVYFLKLLVFILLFYTIIGGFLIDVPRLDILNETIRALHFHVPM